MNTLELAGRHRVIADKYTDDLVVLGVSPGDRFITWDGKTWEYTRCNSAGVPYFVKFIRGRANKTEHIVYELKGRIDKIRGVV